MALPQGVNFRDSLAYVTDGANEEFCNGATAYPTTSAKGINIGWEGTPPGIGSDRNRSTSVDVRLAGIVFNSAIKTFRIDLPSTGDYLVRLAAGDATSSNGTHVELFDTATSLGVLCSGSVIGGSFKDATDVTHTAANWPGSNNSVTKTFSTTILRFDIGGSASGNDVISHFYVEAAAGGSFTPKGVFSKPFSGPFGGPI